MVACWWNRSAIAPASATADRRHPRGARFGDVLVQRRIPLEVYAGAGYWCFGRITADHDYGFKLKTDIVGNYMAPGYEDIIAGVDYLIAQGIADPDRMGASAGARADTGPTGS